jgi:hypothetical protein
MYARPFWAGTKTATATATHPARESELEMFMLMAGLCAPSSSEVRCGVGGRTTGIGERALGDIAGVQSSDEGVGASASERKSGGKWTQSENGGRSPTDDIRRWAPRIRRKWADPRPRALAGSGQSLNHNVTWSGAGAGHVLCYDRERGRYFWAGCLLVDKVVSTRAASAQRRGETQRGERTATASAGWRTAAGRTCTCARQQTRPPKQRRMGARTAQRCRTARRAGSRAASCSWAPRAPLSLSVSHHSTSPNETRTLLRELHEEQLLALLRLRDVRGHERVLRALSRRLHQGEEAHHECLEIRAPPLREAVADLPVALGRRRHGRADGREPLVEPPLQPARLVLARLQVVARPAPPPSAYDKRRGEGRTA